MANSLVLDVDTIGLIALFYGYENGLMDCLLNLSLVCKMWYFAILKSPFIVKALNFQFWQVDVHKDQMCVVNERGNSNNNANNNDCKDEEFGSSKIIQVIACDQFAICLGNNGQLFSFGRGDFGQLGLGELKTSLTPKLIKGDLFGKRIVSVISCRNHSICIGVNGEVYSFGWGEYGQLGHSDTQNQDIPKLIAGEFQTKRIVAASCCSFHTICLTSKGQLFSFGDTRNAVLGLDPPLVAEQTTPKLIKGDLIGKRIIQVSTCYYHSVCLSSKGEVFSFGDGSNGHGNTENQSTPKQVKGVLMGVKIVHVTASSDLTFCIAENGQMFSFGLGTNFQLGHGNNRNQLTPKCIQRNLLGKTIIKVSCSDIHTICLTSDGHVFSFGKGEYGQLGHGDKKDQSTPKLIKGELFGEKMVQVSTSLFHTICLSSHGKLFSFGNGSFGRIGLGESLTTTLTPTEIKGDLQGKRVVQVSITAYYSICLTCDGKVYSFGHGYNGNLGHGDADDVYTPKLIK